MKILYFSDIPSPYSVGYINELGKLADVTAVYEQLSSKDRDSSWSSFSAPNAHVVILKGLSFGIHKKIALEEFILILKNRKSKIIIANPLTSCGILGILFCKFLRIPFIVQSEGGFAKNGKGFKEHFKKFVLKGASLYLSGMGLERNYFLTYGAVAKRIKKYPFSSLGQEDFPQKLLTENEKNVLKKTIGIDGKKVILYVGQFIPRKGVDVLLKAFSGIDSYAELFLIGGSPTTEYRRIIDEKRIKGVHFIDFIQLDELKKYYMMADIFVLPTREDVWGLVVNEAMSYGLPVITTSRCNAGLELIENGKHGYVVPVENEQELNDKMNLILDNPNLRNEMAQNCSDKIKSYTYENMARVIYNHLLNMDNIE